MADVVTAPFSVPPSVADILARAGLTVHLERPAELGPDGRPMWSLVLGGEEESAGAALVQALTELLQLVGAADIPAPQSFRVTSNGVTLRRVV